VSTTSADIPEPDSSSDPEDPEYYDKCLSDYEDLYESYCEARLYQYLNGPAPIEIYALREEHYGPIPKNKEGQGDG
jgi:hypothetical protein